MKDIHYCSSFVKFFMREPWASSSHILTKIRSVYYNKRRIITKPKGELQLKSSINVKKLAALGLAAVMILTCAWGCSFSTDDTKATDAPGNATEQPADGGARYDGPYSAVDGAYYAVDDLGRVVATDSEAGEPRDRKVGIFYFLWQGQHGTSGPYDNYKIVLNDPDAVKSEKNWLKAGGGAQGAHHFWGEPMFGYYTSTDTWVIRKHCQMLTDAGVDFIVFDTTNAVDYSTSARKLIDVWYEYFEMGYNVPKLSYYTNSSSGNTINNIYKAIYGNKRLHEKYPRLSELFYHWDGKPMIVGDPNDKALSDECKEYFRIKASVWPNQYEDVSPDGFPWMEFGRNLTNEAIYGLNGRKEVVNVSIAQHDQTCLMSATAWYGMNDRTRSWHNGANDTSEDAVLYGYNFKEQWEWALGVDPEMIFVTGWNEWVAQRQGNSDRFPIQFVDCCDPNTSRDAEPMAGLFGDNYYLQLINYIRLYKGIAPRVNIGGDVTFDINGGFDQWENNPSAAYTDYPNDTVDRKSTGFGNIKYRDDTGRNDFVSIKAAKDKEKLYFYAKTSEDITPSTDDNWMTLFISSGAEGNALWANLYDFAVNLEKPNGNEVVVSKYNSDGTWSKAGTGLMKVEGNQMMLEVSRELLGIGDDNGSRILDVKFKWADNYQYGEDGKLDVWSFYKNGDAAPLGKMAYLFSEKAAEKANG